MVNQDTVVFEGLPVINHVAPKPVGAEVEETQNCVLVNPEALNATLDKYLTDVLEGTGYVDTHAVLVVLQVNEFVERYLQLGVKLFGERVIRGHLSGRIQNEIKFTRAILCNQLDGNQN